MATASYKIIPDGDELTQIERDLRFYPADTTQPKALTLEQVDAYQSRWICRSDSDLR